MEHSKQSSKFYFGTYPQFEKMAFGAQLKRLKEEAGISAERLANVLNVNAERLRKWMSKDLDPREEDRVKIEKFFQKPIEEIAKLGTIRNYLVDISQYGEHEREANMLHETGEIYVNKSKKEFIELTDGKYIMNTPLITQKAYAGYLTGWGDPEYIEELPMHPVIVDKPHMGTYRSFEGKGDSMNDGSSRSIEDKDILTGRRIERSHWRNKLHLTKYKEYVIVTFKKGIVTKNIIEHDTDNHTITCHSYNPDKERYPDFTLNLDDVMEIYNIVQITKKR